MTQGHLPPASEPDPSVQTSREEAAILRVKETAARFIGALALGSAAVIISAELSRIGSQPPDAAITIGEGVFVSVGTYYLSLASKFGRQADVIDGRALPDQ